MKNPLFIRRVRGNSMLPVLKPGQIIVASGIFKALEPENVVLIYHERLEKIKRLKKIKNGKIFVEGDNQRSSIDSRSFGWLPKQSVVAKVLWPKV